jgi:polyisoprenyl-teichoic acid--peptidoglycan teichoic acid transferase
MRRKRGPMRAFAGRMFIALAIALSMMIGAIIAVNYVIDVKLASAKRVSVHTAVASGGPLNFLVLGSDTQALDNLSDTMWVVRVDPAQRQALVVSFPRDLWVHVPGQGTDKINASNNGGPQLVIDTMKADFGININHYVQIDYKSFQGVVNAIGTVPVYVPYPARDDQSGFYSPVPGCKSFTGYDALQFVRSRTLSYYSLSERRWLAADAVPDIDRIARQQDFVRRLVSLAATKSRNDPLTANAVVNRVLENLTIDAGLSRDDVLTLVDTFLGVNPADTKHVQFETLPSAEGPNQQGQSVLYLAEPNASAMIARLGGTGIGNNPSVINAPTTSSPSTAPTSTPSTAPTSTPSTAPISVPGTTTPGTTVQARSGVLHPSIANQNALGQPALRHAPC